MQVKIDLQKILGKLVGLVIKKIYFHLQKDTTLPRFFAIELMDSKKYL
jgi:hypothetical protein